LVRAALLEQEKAVVDALKDLALIGGGLAVGVVFVLLVLCLNGIL
jgi:hypothetical protein